MNQRQIIINGSIALDRIMSFSGEYHELIESTKLETLSVSVLVDSLTEAPGGTGANIAYSLGALGNKPVLLGSVGENGTAYMDTLTAAGVDTSYVSISKFPTASFSVLTDSKDNQVGGFYPGAMADSASLTLEPWTNQQALVCISANDPAAMRRLCEESVAHKIPLMYDPGQQVSNVPDGDLKFGVEAAEIVIVNDYEMEVLSKKTGLTAQELQATVPVLISTHGAEGSVISGKNNPEPLSIEAVKPVRLADPTGAGDAYRAGFLHGYLRQWDVRKCGQLGAVVASFVLEQNGTQVNITPDLVTERYKLNFNEEIVLD